MNGWSAVATRDLVKAYGKRRALDGFTLSVPRGSMTGLVGPNGAGKTTWMMTVAGYLRPASGVVDVLGRGPFDASVHGGRLAILPQDSDLPLDATPASLLYRYARLQGLSRAAARESAERALARVNLCARSHGAIRTLSHGMRRRVALAQCFLGEPELVLLDEPLNGLDPVEADRVRRDLLALRGRRTFVISSHNLHDVEVLCTHVAFVERGRVTRMDDVRTLTKASERVVYAVTARAGDGAIDHARIDAALAGVPGVRCAWRADGTLVCECAEALGAAAINRRVLPALLSAADVTAVTPGDSLEKVALDLAGDSGAPPGRKTASRPCSP